jgi:hypothetical protein
LLSRDQFDLSASSAKFVLKRLGCVASSGTPVEKSFRRQRQLRESHFEQLAWRQSVADRRVARGD